MNKLVSVFALAAWLVSGMMVARAEERGVVTFLFKNSARYVIYLRMFSQERDATWGPFVLSDDDVHSTRLNCIVGEKICFGGWYNSGTRYWGVGQSGHYSCVGCCMRCGTYGDDPIHTWNLDD